MKYLNLIIAILWVMILGGCERHNSNYIKFEGPGGETIDLNGVVVNLYSADSTLIKTITDSIDLASGEIPENAVYAVAYLLKGSEAKLLNANSASNISVEVSGEPLTSPGEVLSTGLIRIDRNSKQAEELLNCSANIVLEISSPQVNIITALTGTIDNLSTGCNLSDLKQQTTYGTASVDFSRSGTLEVGSVDIFGINPASEPTLTLTANTSTGDTKTAQLQLIGLPTDLTQLKDRTITIKLTFVISTSDTFMGTFLTGDFITINDTIQ